MDINILGKRGGSLLPTSSMGQWTRPAREGAVWMGIVQGRYATRTSVGGESEEEDPEAQRVYS